MVDFLKFAWRCFKQAWRGCWTKANELAGLLGGGILAALLFVSRERLRDMNWIDAPTTIWGTAGYAVALTAASVASAFLFIFSTRLLLAPARLYWEQHRRAAGLEVLLKATSTTSDIGPDWPISEVFYYLEPDLLDDSRWEKAGDRIRDALSLGRLRIWGRLHKTDLGDWVGPRAALRLIDKTYWEKAYFTYTFLEPEWGQRSTHCYADRKTGRPAYSDLQVNRADVLKLWPGEPDDLAEGYPNVRLADSPSVMALFDGSDRAKIIALLVQEKISSWGRVSADVSHDFVLLAGNVWASSAFRCDPKNPADAGSINQTYLRQRNTTNAAFYDVCMNFAQLKRAWPSLEMRRTKCDVL